MSEIDRKQSSTPSTPGGARAPVQRSAGKRSMTDGFGGAAAAASATGAWTDVPMGALQLSAVPTAPPASGAAHDDPFALHLAAQGVAGGGGALPHRDVIQASFGRHDVGGISAHVGGSAAQASAAIGAEAYATGSSVAFANDPSLHLAAHEAAHVVQQRAGVSLKGGMGQAGDAYERHADAVADAVVAGRSAEALLDNGPGGGASSGTAVQGHAIQRNQPGAAAPAAAPASAPADAPAAAPESEGDKMRKAILAAAESRLKEKKEIVSEAEIQDVRTGRIRLKLVVLPDGSEVMMNIPTAVPMKNFTTCIEFAGQTFGDASKAMGTDAKDSQRIAKLLPNIMRIYNEEFALNAQIEAFQKAVQNFDKPIDKTEERKQGFEDKKVELAGQKDGNKAHDKGIDQAIKGQDAAIKQLDAAIATMQREQQKFADKVAKLEEKKDVLDGQDDALIRAGSPLAGHPKPGEYVLLGAGAAQAYGVSAATKVTLAKGAFKHIAVFRSHEPAPSPKDKPDEKWEKWHTIDGGGILAKETQFFICLNDLRVQFAEPDKPWAASTTSLIGWIDMDKLMAAPGGDKPPAK
ncbi:MAG TPA: DUF4157 domain-containing protein [Kofleriaceae bacterium]|nr:DUF4157 domain-containing protein [Kofleriaceae bacterium]